MKKYIVMLLCAVINLSAIAQKKNNKTETFKVWGNCEQCKTRIEATLSNMGTNKAKWNMNTKMLTVSYDSLKLNTSLIKKQLALVGHDNDEFQSDETTYQQLPACCHYKRFPTTTSIAGKDSLTDNQPLDPVLMATITGIVLEENKKGKLLPLSGATIRGIHSKESATSDSAGVFRLKTMLPDAMIVSYVGFTADTINISNASELKVILKNASSNTLKEVILQGRSVSTYVSSISTLNTLNISSRELTKAACCNLSESFETSPSVDVSYADAVTGIKQIQLLGLSGNYTQLLTENTPEIRGLAGSFGLTFIPGPWMEGIQVTKGVGSIVNGYESIAGQINIEEKKPDKAERLFINGYANNLGRLETSLDFAKKINNQWSTSLLTHVNGVSNKLDENKDGFMDIPTGRQYNFINRWKYMDSKGIIAQISLKYLSDQRQAGEMKFNPSFDKFTTNKYGAGIQVEQMGVTAKLGYVFPNSKYKSIGFIVAANKYNNDSYYGLTAYTGKQATMYANLIYQSIIGTTAHKFRTGMSFTNEDFTELFNTTLFKRNEIVPGTFFEYTYTAVKNFSAIAGVRLDHHNQYGWIFTPRLHLKYDINTATNLRFSAGSGLRYANIFAENSGVFVSARQYVLVPPTNNYGYGLDPETAWNYGFNLIHQFKINKHAGSISLDAYSTRFQQQTVVDLDNNPQKILFYNLKGRSFSNSLQAELNYEIIKKLDIRLAYRWLDVVTNYLGTEREKPLVARNRAFVNLAYETPNHWKFDYTQQWFSKKRLPITIGNPIGKQLSTYAPGYTQISAQVSKLFGKHFEIYVGAENIGNFTQQQLFIDANTPFSPYFDGSMIWGPVNGRVLYTGFRFKIK